MMTIRKTARPQEKDAEEVYEMRIFNGCLRMLKVLYGWNDMSVISK